MFVKRGSLNPEMCSDNQMNNTQRSANRRARWWKHVLVIASLLTISPLLCIYTWRRSERLILYVYGLVTRRGLAVTLDDDGVPINDYQYMGSVYVGKQRYPITIAQRAIVCWNEDFYLPDFYYPFKDKNTGYNEHGFLSCVKWIVNNATSRGNYAVWEFNFPFEHYNLTAPWRSAMAQGQCIQALVRAHRLTGDDSYLELARKALGAFHVEVADGGVTHKGDDGWWYEEYACEGGANPRVLNGHIFALEGIREFYTATTEEEAKYLFDKGILALKAHLPDYDTGAWTCYDTLGEKATEGYHKLHVAQMLHLHQLTNDPAFLQYFNRWITYKCKPKRFPIKLIEEPTKTNIAIYLLNFTLVLFIVEMAVRLVSRVSRVSRGS